MRETLRIFDFFFHNYYGSLGTMLRVIESVSIRRHRPILCRALLALQTKFFLNALS